MGCPSGSAIPGDGSKLKILSEITPPLLGRNREAEELMLRMANTNKVPDINLEIHRTSRSNSGENEGTIFLL